MARQLEVLADRCQRIVAQIHQRARGEKISDRLVSLADPDARPIRKGKLGTPNEFDYVVQVAEVTANTGRGARGYVLPAASAPGNPGETRLLTQTAAELDRLGLARERSPSTAASCPAPDPADPGPAGACTDVHRRAGRARLPGAPAGGWPLSQRL